MQQMADTIKTARLFLRPFTPDDAPALFRFMSDPVAMRHTYVAPTPEHCLARLRVYESMRSTLGFAPWVARLAEQGEPVGWGGLSVDPDELEWGLEVSYAFAPAVWGKGYATELVRFAVELGFGLLSACEIHAFAKPDNTGSVRVLEKCGFTSLRYEPRLERNHYLLTSPGG
jgi:ribosomal-protein-alanine N-acetyltransferase